MFHRLRFKHFLIYILKKHTCKVQYFQLLITVWNFTEESNQTINIMRGKVKTNSHSESCRDASNTNTVVTGGQE